VTGQRKIHQFLGSFLIFGLLSDCFTLSISKPWTSIIPDSVSSRFPSWWIIFPSSRLIPDMEIKRRLQKKEVTTSEIDKTASAVNGLAWRST